MNNFIDKTVFFGEDADGLFVGHTQEIPEDFLARLQSEKNETQGRRAGTFLRVASIPTVIVEKWLREGFDVSKEPVRESLKRLRNEHLDDFITTTKKI